MLANEDSGGVGLWGSERGEDASAGRMKGARDYCYMESSWGWKASGEQQNRVSKEVETRATGDAQCARSRGERRATSNAKEEKRNV